MHRRGTHPKSLFPGHQLPAEWLPSVPWLRPHAAQFLDASQAQILCLSCSCDTEVTGTSSEPAQRQVEILVEVFLRKTIPEPESSDKVLQKQAGS